MRNKIAGWAVKVGLSIAVLSLVTGSAFADPSFDITGSTTGQFSLLGVPLGTSLNGLSFNGSDFGPTTVTNGSDVQINLGTFTLNTLLSYFDPFDFKLSVNFTAPTVGGTVFKADLSGLVSIFGGSATVNFIDNGPRHFSYSNSTGAGSFDLYLSDMRVNNHSQASIQGRIMNVSANPEPAAIALTSALMGGLLFLFRRRLRNS